MTIAIDKFSKLVMIGDSITDCGRSFPIGMGRTGGLGNGYVSLVDSLLQTVYPDHPVQVINMGISGNTVRDLKGRWQQDVLDLQPDWLSIKIGINDVWRKFGTPPNLENHVPLDEYKQSLDRLVASTRPILKGLMLLTPYMIEPDRGHPMRAMMDLYGKAVNEIAAANQAIIVDTQAAFDKALIHMPPADLAEDQVHPNQAGHMIIAKSFLDSLGFQWNRPAK